MSVTSSSLQQRSALLRALHQVTEFVTAPAPLDDWRHLAPEAEREWAARCGQSTLDGVVGRLAHLLEIGLGGATREHGLAERLLALSPSDVAGRLALDILLAAYDAWP